MIHTLCAKRLQLHEFAIERLTLDAAPDERLRDLVLPDDMAAEMREIANILAVKLEIRKRGM